MVLLFFSEGIQPLSLKEFLWCVRRERKGTGRGFDVCSILVSFIGELLFYTAYAIHWNGLIT